jgi:predicted RNA-binding Zn-ribbon protein involved in translation (DUF1610 family)
MRCPKCGEEMNHHADKVADPINPRDAAAIDPDLGGVLYETHGCPGCGNVELVKTEGSPSTSNFHV